jgi:hypothetical protein
MHPIHRMHPISLAYDSKGVCRGIFAAGPMNVWGVRLDGLARRREEA